MNIAQDIADTIIYFAELEIKKEDCKYKNLNSAIHAIKVDVTNILMDKMKYEKGK